MKNFADAANHRIRVAASFERISERINLRWDYPVK